MPVAQLTTDEADAVLALARVVGDADGVDPLSEHVTLHLTRPGATHTLLRGPDGALVGYAFADDEVAEFCVHPLHRRQGLGRSLLAAVAGRSTSLWAHGTHPSAVALALAAGLTPARALWRMRRPLAGLAAPMVPPGITLRPFRPGVDDDAWLAVNARAFAHLPDQGGWTRADLELRLAEPWFDPAGFLLAFSAAGELLGFHWTKVHPDGMGEVYVLGVSPEAPRVGLGSTLTLAGLAHLRASGLERVMLYVDSTNEAAIKLYTRLGFARWSTDTCYAPR